MRKVLFSAALLALSAGAQAQVFKCVDGQGKVTFSQVPCPGQDTEKVEVRNNKIGGQFATGEEVSDNNARRDAQRGARQAGRARAAQSDSACKQFSDQEVRTMVLRHEVVPGMKMQDVFKAWGKPDESSERRHIWWFDTVKGSFIWHKDGCVESMSGPGYRGSKFVR